MQEGLAHLCLIGSATTLQKAKIEMTMPRKRGAAAAGYDTAYKNFLNRVTTPPPHPFPRFMLLNLNATNPERNWAGGVG